jgi:exosortase family protein XrtM
MTPTRPSPARHPATFLLLFAVFYGLFYAAYFAVPDRLLVREVYEPTLVAPAGVLVNLISASEQATWADNRLQSRRAILDVVRGCDGIGLLLLLTAAVLAFPAPWRLKLVGVLGGWLVMYLLNLARIVGLYFVVAYQGAWFIPLHTLLIPGALVLLGGLYFHLWTAWVVRQGAIRGA